MENWGKGRIEACFVLALSLGAWLFDFAAEILVIPTAAAGTHRMVMRPHSIITTGG